MLKFMPIALGLFSFSTMALTETKKFSSKGLESLRIDNSSGLIRVIASESDKASVTFEKIKFEEGCNLHIEIEGKELIVEIEKEGWFKSDDCHVKLDVHVPKSVFIKVRNRNGDLEIFGGEGEMDVRLGSGTLLVKKLE